MEKSFRANRYSTEVRARAVRMILEHEHEYANQSTAIMAIAPKIGCGRDTLRRWVKQSDIDSGRKDGQTTDERAQIKAMEREIRELRQANEILRKASAYFAPALTHAGMCCHAMGRSSPARSNDDFFHCRASRRPGCRAGLQGFANRPIHIYAHVAIAQNPDLASDRAKRDVDLSPEVKRVWEENNEVYGIRKVRHQLQRETFTIARCTVARLMKNLDIHGVIRGKMKKTTVPDKSQPCPKDKVNRKFRAPAPNMLWVSDFTYVSTWQGFVYVAFIIDTFADKIVGWRVSSSPKTEFVLDALEQALHDRRPAHKGGLIHHSNRGGQYLSIRYTERLALAGIEPSVGSVGDSYDNALAETLNDLYKAEVIHRLGPWKTMAAVEWETLKWVDWFNNRRLLEPIGYIPPAEAEEKYYAQFNALDMVA